MSHKLMHIITSSTPTSKHYSVQIQFCSFYVLCGFHSLNLSLRPTDGINRHTEFKILRKS